MGCVEEGGNWRCEGGGWRVGGRERAVIEDNGGVERMDVGGRRGWREEGGGRRIGGDECSRSGGGEGLVEDGAGEGGKVRRRWGRVAGGWAETEYSNEERGRV